MTRLATEGNSYFIPSRMEIDRDGMTYTIDTIKALKKELPDDVKIYFIMGADAISEIFTWKNSAELLKMCSFAVATRQGFDKEKLKRTLKRIIKMYDAHLKFVDVPDLEISSTDIRNRIVSGKTIRYLVPERVYDYIMEKQLYVEKDENKNKYLAIKNKLHTILSEERFTHSLGVADEAVKIARRYNADTDSAYIAGLLHDCAKDYTPKKKIKLAKKYNFHIDYIMEQQVDLTHSFLGSFVAEDKYGITDRDVLNAIEYHTTGRDNMSLLEKIIFLADSIEPNRKPYPDLERLRKLVYEDIDKAMQFSLETTIDYNIRKGRLIHPLSRMALEYFRKITGMKNQID